MLISLWTGRKPTLRTYEMICYYFTGLASEDELLAHLAKLQGPRRGSAKNLTRLSSAAFRECVTSRFTLRVSPRGPCNCQFVPRLPKIVGPTTLHQRLAAAIWASSNSVPNSIGTGTFFRVAINRWSWRSEPKNEPDTGL